MNTKYGVYYWSSCDYVAHLDCATKMGGRELTFEWKLEEESIESTTKVKEEKIEIPIEIKHFSHVHDLKLTNELENYDELENYEICDMVYTTYLPSILQVCSVFFLSTQILCGITQ